MSLESIDAMLSDKVVYGIFFDNDVYIGQTSDKLITRLGQHLDKYKTVKNYIVEHKPKKAEIKILYQYKNNHKNLTDLLENKESQLMIEYHKKGYHLINKSKMKKLGLA